MAIFLVLQQRPNATEALSKAIHESYPENFYELGDGAWLISDSSTAKAVSDRLGITEGVNGSGIVVEFASYYGRANPAIWSWIKSKWEAGPHG